jgi:hypothetical protein
LATETAVVAPIAALASGLTVGPNPVGRGGAVKFFYSGGRVAGGTLAIYDATGNFVKKLNIGDAPAAITAGDNTKRSVGSWDLTDYKQRAVCAGSYLIKGVLFTPTGKKENVSVPIGVR